MAALTNYTENKLIDFLLRGQAFVPPTTVYLALYTAAPDDTGGGTEVAGGAYARASVNCSTAAWAGTQAPASVAVSNGTTGLTSNNAAITFATPTAAWGTITHVGVFDAATGGNLLMQGALTSPQVVNTGNTVSFPAASMQFQLDN